MCWDVGGRFGKVGGVGKYGGSVGKCFGCGESEKRCGKGCWGVGKVRGEVGGCREV